MKKEIRKVSFDLPVDMLERLDKLAVITDLPRQKLISNLVEAGIETLEDCQKVGLLQFSLLMRDMKKDMKDWAAKISNKQDLIGLE
jgi:predicted DNA-binding protein